MSAAYAQSVGAADLRVCVATERPARCASIHGAIGPTPPSFAP